MSDPDKSPSSEPEGGSPPPEKGGRRRWTGILLVVSLGLNLAVAGLIAGAVLRNSNDRSAPVASQVARNLGLGPYLRALEPADRRALGMKARDRVIEAGGIRAQRTTQRQNLVEVLASLRADPFDPARFAAALEAQAVAAEGLRRVGQAALVDHLSNLNATDRAAYADRLEQAFRHPRGRKPDRPAQDRQKQWR